MRTRLALLLLAGACAAAAVLVAEDGGSDDRPGKRATTRFEPCRPGAGGGGYNVRIFAISCAEARKVLPRMLGQREPVVKRPGEYVYVNDDGWTCHMQAVRALQASEVTCVRGEQLIVYRVS